MFTGIIADVGQITAVTPLADNLDAGVRLQVQTVALDMSDVALGDSIAINGACMTVVSIDTDAKAFAVDVSRESLNKTAGLDTTGPVNLEKLCACPTDWAGIWSVDTWMMSRALSRSRQSVSPMNWCLALIRAGKNFSPTKAR